MIAIGSDHAGYEIKNAIIAHLSEQGIENTDFGCYSSESCDYTDFAHEVANGVQSCEFGCGILVCSTGIGMSIAANRHVGVRAGLCYNVEAAQLTREHNNANVLCIGAKFVDEKLALEIVDKFLNTDFSNVEKHIRRVVKIEDGEKTV